MADTPINLNRVRKQRARLAARRQADENAVRFGRSAAERERARRDTETADRRLDGHRRDDDDTA